MAYDLVLKNGSVMDAETETEEILNVGISDGKIRCLTKEALTGKKEIDAAGHIVSPGFIDIHIHEDFFALPEQMKARKYTLPLEVSKAMISAGVTTVVGGNCGFSAYPIGDYLENVTKANLPLNYYSLVGYGTLREQLGIGNYSAAGEDQMQLLKSMVEESLRSGAVGVSFGLQYAPGTATNEILEIARLVKKYDKYVAVHLRYDYPEKAVETVGELLGVARETGVRLQLSHLAANVYGSGVMGKTLETISELNRQGFDIKADMYPYDTWATGIKSTVFDGNVFGRYHFRYEDIEILTGKWSGQRCTPELYALLRAQQEDENVACHNATPWEDIVQAYQSPFVFFGSDAIISKDPETGDIKGHPRSVGSTAKFLKLARDEGKINLRSAIRKLTLDPTNRLQLKSKGRLQIGMDADITVFNVEQLDDKGDFGVNTCALPSEGIKHVITGGKIVFDEQIRETLYRDIVSKTANAG